MRVRLYLGTEALSEVAKGVNTGLAVEAVAEGSYWWDNSGLERFLIAEVDVVLPSRETAVVAAVQGLRNAQAQMTEYFEQKIAKMLALQGPQA